MLTGSDVSGSAWEVPGYSLHQEFDELSRAGLSPARILRMATADAADFLHRADHSGTIAEGYDADLLLLTADPTAAAANLHTVDAVFRAGHHHTATALKSLRDQVATARATR